MVTAHGVGAQTWRTIVTCRTSALLNHRDTRVASEISNLMAAAYAAEARLLGVRNFPPLRHAMAGKLVPHNVYVGVRSRDALVAAAEIEACSDGGIVIATMVVSPCHFRQGFGETLVRDVVGTFRYSYIEVGTARDNEPACALYAKVGFRPVSTWITADGFSLVTLRYED